MFLHHVLVELCFHRHGLGLLTPSLTQQCELTAHVEVKRRCFSPPPRLSQPGVSTGLTFVAVVSVAVCQQLSRDRVGVQLRGLHSAELLVSEGLLGVKDLGGPLDL